MRQLRGRWFGPPREFSLMPFWFWNDALEEAELVRQMADFQAHGVHGFVIHPRVGLPRDIGWMSARMLQFVRLAVEEASRRGMRVVLYDEGMYPSGSSSGQVVAENPAYRCRCLSHVPLDSTDVMVPISPGPGEVIVAVVARADGRRIAVVDRPADSCIRGLHYVLQSDGSEGQAEDEPPAADILNPNAVATFIRLVYDRYAEAVGDHFGATVVGIFTDEPGLLGRCRERDVWPGTTDILGYVNDFLGYDFAPHLPALWYDDEPSACRYRADYHRAVARRLEETYYRPLFEWCEAHGVALTGHPARGDDIGLMRYFHIPGQDLVWRWVAPGEANALEGPESTQAKCSASAALHLGRRRNSSECFGAYGHSFTWAEMKWLADWCFVRGVNLLYPHAFYYSVRGPRWDERPPDVGPHSAWWGDYRRFADFCRRMSWLNTDSQHVCRIAILSEAVDLPWSAASICLQRQRDFNYLEMRHLWEDAEASPAGVVIAGMRYRAIIIDGLRAVPRQAQPALETLCDAARLIQWGGCAPAGIPEGVIKVVEADDLVSAVDQLVPRDLVAAPPAPGLRYRHVVKNGIHYYIICNEDLAPLHTRLTVPVSGRATWVDPLNAKEHPIERPFDLVLPPYTLHILRIGPGNSLSIP